MLGIFLPGNKAGITSSLFNSHSKSGTWLMWFTIDYIFPFHYYARWAFDVSHSHNVYFFIVYSYLTASLRCVCCTQIFLAPPLLWSDKTASHAECFHCPLSFLCVEFLTLSTKGNFSLNMGTFSCNRGEYLLPQQHCQNRRQILCFQTVRDIKGLPGRCRGNRCNIRGLPFC